MRFCIGGGLPFPFDGLAGFQTDNDHVLRLHIVIADAGGLDDHSIALAVNAADIAPCVNDNAAPHKLQIGLANFLFQFFQHSDSPYVDFEPRSAHGDFRQAVVSVIFSHEVETPEIVLLT